MRALFLAALCATAAPAYAETAAEFIARDNASVVKDVGGNERSGEAMLVGVLDDGSRRDRFAEALCLSVAKMPDAPSIIRIMDVAAATRGEWKVLGRATCPKPGDETVVEFN